jgi:pimeloyl-ACP methyl ester carboxylesterase
LKLFYRKFGDGKPLLILHGLFGASDNWVTIGKRLAEKYEVIIPDLRNHGQSPHSDEWQYDAMAEDVFDLTAHLGLKKISLIGHSMGGKVGMTLASKYPELLEKLVVVDIAPRKYPVQHRNILDGLLSIDLQSVSSRKEAEDQLSKYVPEPGVRQFLLKNLDRSSDRGFKWKLNLKVINDHIEGIGTATIPDQEVKIPAMFVRGINSHYVSDEDILEIRNYFSASVIESIGNAGHWVHAEQPEAFIRTVMDFL